MQSFEDNLNTTFPWKQQNKTPQKTDISQYFYLFVFL